MPTTTAQITLSSADLTGDALQLTSLTTLTGHASNSGLTHTTGVNRITFASAQTAYKLVAASAYSDTTKAHKVYIKNLSTSNSEFVTIEIGSSNPFVCHAAHKDPLSDGMLFVPLHSKLLNCPIRIFLNRK